MPSPYGNMSNLSPAPFRSTTSRSPATSPSPRPAKHIISSPSSPAKSSIFATRQRPPSHLGGLIVCAGCQLGGTERETVVGPLGRRYHARCLVCGGCGRRLDSGAKVGEEGGLRCGGCRVSLAYIWGSAKFSVTELILSINFR